MKITKTWRASPSLIVYGGLLWFIALFNISYILGSDVTSDAKDFSSNLYSSQCDSVVSVCYFEGLYLYQKYLSFFTEIFGRFSGVCLSVFVNITILVVLLNKYRRSLSLLISKTPIILITLLSPATLLYFTAPLREILKVIISILIIECLISARGKNSSILGFAQESVFLTLLVLLYSGIHKTSIVIVTATLASWSLTLLASIRPSPINSYKVNKWIIYLAIILIPAMFVLLGPVSTRSSIMFEKYLGKNSMAIDTPLMYSYAIASPADAVSRLVLFTFPLRVVTTTKFFIILIDSLGFIIVLFSYIKYLPSFGNLPKLRILLVNCWLVAYYAVYSLSSGNYGTAMRHRLSLSWMMVFIICVYLDMDLRKKDELFPK